MKKVQLIVILFLFIFVKGNSQQGSLFFNIGALMGFTSSGSLYGIFSETKQLSAYFEANKELKKGLNFGFTGAFDVGELYYDSFGLLLNLFKSTRRCIYTTILVCTCSLLVHI